MSIWMKIAGDAGNRRMFLALPSSLVDSIQALTIAVNFLLSR